MFSHTLVERFLGHPIPLGIGVKKCNLEGYRWHDIRHTLPLHHVQNGTPLHGNILVGGPTLTSLIVMLTCQKII